MLLDVTQYSIDGLDMDWNDQLATNVLFIHKDVTTQYKQLVAYFKGAPCLSQIRNTRTETFHFYLSHIGLLIIQKTTSTERQ